MRVWPLEEGPDDEAKAVQSRSLGFCGSTSWARRPPVSAASKVGSESQSRGTELSGAETGGEKPPERRALSRRDREREKQAARYPQKRPLFDRRRFPRFGK